MKKYFFTFALLQVIFVCYLSAQERPSLIIQETELENHEINIVGLVAIDILFINNGNVKLVIDSPKEIKTYINLIDSAWSTTFREGNLRFSSGRQTVHINPGETLSYKINVNTLELLRLGGIRYFAESKEIALRFGISCYNNNTKYYSTEIQLKINPLSKIDQAAFAYIKESGFDPFDFSRKGTITSFGINESIANSVLAKYPESAFAELARLSLAYQGARESKAKPELTDQVNQLLEKPLASKYSFVRYLAEELKKKQ